MAVQVKLIMVGPYKGKDKVIKNVQFKGGVAFVRGAEDKIMHILKYLKGYGAFPANEAEAEQAKIDAYLATQGDTKAMDKRKADLRTQLAELEKVEAAPAETEAPTEAPAAPTETPKQGATDGTVSDPETPEGRGGQQVSSGKTSGKRRRQHG